MKKPIFIILILTCLITLLSIVQVVVSNRLSTTGITLSELQDKLKIYKKENSLLSEKLLVESSLTRIASNAASIGFVESKSEVYLLAPLPLAVKP